MMKTTNEELAVVVYNNDGSIHSLGGQFIAKDAKEYFAALKENFKPVKQ